MEQQPHHRNWDLDVRPPWASMVLFTLLAATFTLLVVWFAAGVGISTSDGTAVAGWIWKKP